MSSYVNLHIPIHRFLSGWLKILRLVAIAASIAIVPCSHGVSDIHPWVGCVQMDRALQVREILSTRSLSLYRLSQQSAEIFGRSSQFYIPHNLYYDLARPSSKPTIYQTLALSHITNYRLPDWLAVFGFDLDAIFQLQMEIPRKRTTILDSTVYDTNAWIPWFADRTEAPPTPSIAPLGQLLALGPPRRASELLGLNRRKFLYARVGDQDWYALPYFTPGSTVRVDTRLEEPPLGRTSGQGPFFFVEHDLGWTCSRLIRLTRDRVLLHCPQWPCAERELHLGREARILGVIDAEIRRLTPHRPRQVVSKSAAVGKPRLAYPAEQTTLKGLLRRSRVSAGLSFREASSISRSIADTLSDELYFAAASTLSDYEVLSAPPRHTEKIITLCVLYCIGFDQFLRASGFPLEQAGREPIPDDLIPRQMRSRNHSLRIHGPDDARESSGFLTALMNQWEEVPLFLRFSLEEMTGLKRSSLSDVFWVGGDETQRHRLLINATFVVVNRRARKPAPPAEYTICEEPLFLILKRDGSYLCGCCTLDEGNLIVHGYPRGEGGTQQFRDGADAEVVGQITAILRRLL